MKALHQAGIVVGDINGSNLQCKADGQLALLDCDDWQVQVNGKLYYARSGTERLTCPRVIAQYCDHPSLCHNRNCPEYGAQHPRDIGFDPRTQEHDRYALQALERRITAQHKIYDETPVWVAEREDHQGRAITGIDVSQSEVVIRTREPADAETL